MTEAPASRPGHAYTAILTDNQHSTPGPHPGSRLGGPYGCLQRLNEALKIHGEALGLVLANFTEVERAICVLINLKAAKALNISVPSFLLQSADDVIE